MNQLQTIIAKIRRYFQKQATKDIASVFAMVDELESTVDRGIAAVIAEIEKNKARAEAAKATAEAAVRAAEAALAVKKAMLDAETSTMNADLIRAKRLQSRLTELVK